jgi:Reverse transcriptase-like
MILPQLISLALLILQFDGSLGPPRDCGFPVSKLGDLATCSAALLIDDETRGVIALGGKLIPLHPGMTSADVEFEGFLLGLEFICRNKDHWSVATEIVVEGDCKAVIDILNLKSSARKLSPYFDKALQNMAEIQNVSFIFNHIPRRSNSLCDSVCQHLKLLAIDETIHELLCGIESTAIGLAISLRLYFDIASIIPFSKRPSLYIVMLNHARSLKDGLGMLLLGYQVEDDSKSWPNEFRRSLIYLAISIQCEALYILNKNSQAMKLRNRFRFLLEENKQSSDSVLIELSKRYPQQRNSSEIKVDVSNWMKGAKALSCVTSPRKVADAHWFVQNLLPIQD